MNNKEIEKRDRRVVISVKPSTYREWKELADSKHWTVTTLVEVVMGAYVDCSKGIKQMKSDKRRK